MREVDTMEEVCADAWPPLVEHRLGQWRLRAAGGYTGRANSALAVGDPGLAVPSALAVLTEFAEAHGIRPYAQVVVGSAVEADLADAGWAVNLAHPKGAESAVLTSALTVPTDGAEVAGEPPDGWLELAVGGTPSAAQRHVLTSGPRVGYAGAYRDGALVGVARGCMVAEWLHVSVVEVVPEARGRGVARSLLAGLDRWAATRRRVLQVAVRNVAALALYRGLGYTESHRYRYWSAS
ncbi:GNAT family N-acetyltransferase [Actinokineospora sp.]|uniref:GNAT family N-acetyltransferase n=1 Tax=Actinokineospora sp. TaxID=1872133 RepID=UPI0040383C77